MSLFKNIMSQDVLSVHFINKRHQKMASKKRPYNEQNSGDFRRNRDNYAKTPKNYYEILLSGKCVLLLLEKYQRVII